MNNLQTISKQLPDTLEDLSKFVLVGREKLNAVRAEIRAIDKVGLAKEVHEQKLSEAQDIADAVLDAEVRIGELTSKIEKHERIRTDLHDTAVEQTKTKTAQLQEIGIPQKTAERFERLAKHPELVQEAKDAARETGTIVTRQDVLNRIVTSRAANPAKERRDFIEKVQVRHEEFEENKSSGVVDFSEAIKDKQNVEILKNEIYTRLMRMGKDITAVYVDLRELPEKTADYISEFDEDEKEGVIRHVGLLISELTEIREVINGKTADN